MLRVQIVCLNPGTAGVSWGFTMAGAHKEGMPWGFTMTGAHEGGYALGIHNDRCPQGRVFSGVSLYNRYPWRKGISLCFISADAREGRACTWALTRAGTQGRERSLGILKQKGPGRRVRLGIHTYINKNPMGRVGKGFPGYSP